MSSWLQETQLVQNLAQNLLVPKKTKYQEDMIRFTALQSNRLQFKTQTVINNFGEKLRTTVFLPLSYEGQSCIIYLHGYGSHRLEGLSILPHLPKQIGLCCFDFSGSGKSQGNTTTFGYKQSLDIEHVIKMLKQQFGFKKIVLWGRSMGAVASILYCSKNKNKDIFFQVLDSPFSSFQTISLHHAKNIIGLPQVFLNFGVGIVKQHLKTHQFNPYNMNMCDSIKSCETPTLFVFCEGDKIIPAENSYKIIENFPHEGIYEKYIIEEDHNTFRSKETISHIVDIVKRYIGCEKTKQKHKYRKGFGQIISSMTPNGKSQNKRNFGFIECSLSNKNKNNPESLEKKSSLPAYGGFLSPQSLTPKN